NPVRRLRRRLVKEPTQWRKLMVPRLLALRADGWLTAGAHQFLLGDRPCRPALAKHAHLAHFPVRSAGQYQAKVALNYLQYQAMADRPSDYGWHYRKPFALL